MLGIDVQAACAPHDKQASIRTAEDAAQVRSRPGNPADGFSSPGAKGVHHYIEAIQILGGQFEQILYDRVFRFALIFIAHH